MAAEIAMKTSGNAQKSRCIIDVDQASKAKIPGNRQKAEI
jgi:hypothetical protein